MRDRYRSMGNGDKPAPGSPASRLQRMLNFCRRVLTPAGPGPGLPGEPPPVYDPELDRLEQRFSNEMFARLLLELPARRGELDTAYRSGDFRRLGRTVHQLIGATAYCAAPELDSALRELRLALQTGEHDRIERHFIQAINQIDNTLRDSGSRRDG